MQDGRIQRQGTLDEIAQADPELYNGWKDAANLVSEAEADPSEYESESESERKILKRQISRQMTVEEEEKKKAGGLIMN